MKTKSYNDLGGRLFGLLLVLSFGCSLSIAFANPKAGNREEKDPLLQISKSTIQASMDGLNNRQGLDDALKSKLLSAYQLAIDNLNLSEKYNAQAADFKKAGKTAPEQTRMLQKSIDNNASKVEDFSRIPTAELEQRFVLERSKLTDLDEKKQEKEEELILHLGRLQKIREEKAAARIVIEDSQKNLESLNTAIDSKLEVEAKQMQMKTQIEARTAEVGMLDAEAASNPIRIELIKTQLQWLEVQKNEQGSVIAAIESLLSERRQEEAQQIRHALSEAEKELSGKHPLLQQVTRENIQYSRALQMVSANIEKYSELKNRFDAKKEEIDSDYKSAEKKINLAGLSPALGRVLRGQRRNLIKQEANALQTESIQNETASTSLSQLDVEEKLKRFLDIDSYLNDIMKTMVDYTSLPIKDRMMVQAELRVLLNSQKEVLNKLSAANRSYLRNLGDVDFSRRQLLIKAQKFSDLLDQRLLWVPSSDRINADFPIGLYQSLRWFLSPANWRVVVKDTFNLAKDNPFLTIFGLFCLLFLRSGRQWAKRRLADYSEKVNKIYTDNFIYTWKAFACSVILDLPLPLLIYCYGWFLTIDFHSDSFSRAIGEGLRSIATPLFIMQLFYRLFSAEGIAVRHFQWQKSNAEMFRKEIAWVRFIAIPGVFVITVTANSDNALHGDCLGRTALIMIMTAMAFFFGRLLRPDRGLLYSHIQAHPDGWTQRLRYVWYPMLILIPVTVIGFAVAGYYLSALELEQKLIITIRWAFFLVLLYEIVMRWLILVNRQLALKNARQKRKAASQQEKQSAAGSEDPVIPVDENLIDIPKINAQTVKLLNVFITFSILAGIWIIWENILPAFSFLEQIELWQHSVKVDNQDIMKPVTLANLLLAGFYVFICTVSVRNFSGLMELLVFRRWSIEPGERYAVNQLAKYSLITIGFIFVANELGGSWSEVQWLVAALGVGLGFGLQEIFANLVSGIILLFERPIRIGDTVTISDVTGKVCRIQMRATTLIDWDQKELIVPNKTFITNQLINWSLTDPTTRIVIPVGIAYGSDVELAHQIMTDTVKNTPLVLAEPAPSVIFIGFGESSLDFSIRVFVSDLANRLPVTHDLHVRLEKALRENDIVIPFPQREVHVRNEAAKVQPATTTQENMPTKGFAAKGG